MLIWLLSPASSADIIISVYDCPKYHKCIMTYHSRNEYRRITKVGQRSRIRYGDARVSKPTLDDLIHLSHTSYYGYYNQRVHRNVMSCRVVNIPDDDVEVDFELLLNNPEDYPFLSCSPYCRYYPWLR